LPGPGGGGEEKGGKPTVEGASLSVTRKLDEKKFLFSFAATNLSVQVTYPGKQLLGVDPSSSVAEFRDDKNTSLLPRKGTPKPTFRLARVSKDHGSLVAVVSSTEAPARGATRLRLKGSLVLRCGLGEKTAEGKEVELKAGLGVKVGDFTVLVGLNPGFGSNLAPGDLPLDILAPAPVIKCVTATGPGGTAVEVEGEPVPFGDGKSWRYAFALKKPPKRAKIAIQYFSKEEKVTVPVDLTVGVGL
jgi:hypothetical protein